MQALAQAQGQKLAQAQAQALAEAVGPSIDAAVQQYTVQAAAAAPVSGGEISVQA